MINSINTQGPHLQSNTSDSGVPYVSPNDGVPFMGMMRCVNQQFQIWNGGGWIPANGGYTSISLSAGASAAIEWANEKMNEERKINALAKSNTSIADALKAVNRAKEQLDIIIALTDKEPS